MLKSIRNNVNVRGLRPVTAVNWAYKHCFIGYNMQDEIKITSNIF